MFFCFNPFTGLDLDGLTEDCELARALDFDDGSFDVVANRHSTFEPAEVARVLKSAGYFVTQQVGHLNAASLLGCFSWSDSFPDDWLIPLRDRASQFEASGMSIVGLAEYEVDWWIKDVESVLFWLRSVPTPDEFDLEKHWSGINVMQDRLLDENGFRTTEHRELLVARKV